MAKNSTYTGRKPTLDAQGRTTTGFVADTRRIIAIVGNSVGALALLIGIGAIAWLLNLTVNDNSISSVFPDDVAGTSTIAFPTLMAFLALTGFIFGQFAARGKWGTGADAQASTFAKGSFRVELRPISVALHTLFLLLALLAWALVMLLPVVADAQGTVVIPVGSSAAEQFWFTVTVYGLLTGAIAAMVAVSLLKKLTYTKALQRNASYIIDRSPSQQMWRKYSHIWRAELGIAGAGGGALGLSPLGVHLDSAAYGFGALGIGLALLIIAVLVALNSWRSGLPVERVESYT
jgi:hypothetical protein